MVLISVSVVSMKGLVSCFSISVCDKIAVCGEKKLRIHPTHNDNSVMVSQNTLIKVERSQLGVVCNLPPKGNIILWFNSCCLLETVQSVSISWRICS